MVTQQFHCLPKNKYFLAFKQDIIKNKLEDWQFIYLNSKDEDFIKWQRYLVYQIQKVIPSF